MNLPFAKPLEPVEDSGDVPEGFPENHGTALVGRDPAPLVEIGIHRTSANEEELDRLAGWLEEAERPVLVAGVASEPARIGSALTRFAAAAGVPLLADPLSGARAGPGHGSARITAYDLFLRSAEVRRTLEPDLVIRVGAGPTSAALLRWLSRHGSGRQVVVDGGGRWKDHQNTATNYLQADPAETLRALLPRIRRPSPAAWRHRWETVDRATAKAAASAVGPSHEGQVAEAVMRGVDSDDVLFVSNSMPIRDVDAFGGERGDGLLLLGNRGASGIDGIVSTAAGVAAGAGRRTVVLLGDLAFLHDANGLLAVREAGVELGLVVVNNDGGGIFHMLPIREHDPPFTRLFATPHGLDLSHLARLHGLPHTRVEGAAGVREALSRHQVGGGSFMVEVITDREANRVGHQAAFSAAESAALEALEKLESDDSGEM
ncbi:MAG: thiamine pyrophosphate-dependent enzyme [Gemmatimonadota bacterium]